MDSNPCLLLDLNLHLLLDPNLSLSLNSFESKKRMNNILDEIRDMKRFGGGDGCKFAAE